LEIIMSTDTVVIRTDDATSFAVADSERGHGHRRLYGVGPHVLAAEAWSQPGGPRGTSSPQKLPAGAIITRTAAGDEYTCASWRATLPR
jgi:hypothetical protein